MTFLKRVTWPITLNWHSASVRARAVTQTKPQHKDANHFCAKNFRAAFFFHSTSDRNMRARSPLKSERHTPLYFFPRFEPIRWLHSTSSIRRFARDYAPSLFPTSRLPSWTRGSGKGTYRHFFRRSKRPQNGVKRTLRFFELQIEKVHGGTFSTNG